MGTPGGKAISHAKLQIDDYALMLADELPQIENQSPTTLGRTSGGTFLYIEYVEKTFIHAVSDDAKVLVPVKDEFWDDKHGAIEDPFVYRWAISTQRP